MDPNKPIVWPAWAFAVLALALVALVLVAEWGIDSWADGTPCTVRVLGRTPIAGPGGSTDGYTVTVVGVSPAAIADRRYTYRTESPEPTGTTLPAVYRPDDLSDVLPVDDHRRDMRSAPAVRWGLFAAAALYLAGFARWLARGRRARARAVADSR